MRCNREIELGKLAGHELSQEAGVYGNRRRNVWILFQSMKEKGETQTIPFNGEFHF